MNSNIELARIKPFEYLDELTGHKVTVKVSPYDSKLLVDDRAYYFNKGSGEFDGTSIPMGDKGS